MITVKLPQKTEKLLADMAKASGRTTDQVAVDAILEAIEDWQDARIAEERVRNDDGVRIPLEEMIRQLELREGDERSNKPATE
ncbi:MAG: CopG family transcriptional regulator [Mesorhizobium sp.]|nr:MAG: CopG family transcriptional regulator [Mesorhizobium sp.]